MSMAPLQVNGEHARWGVTLGQGMVLGDALWDGLTDSHAGVPMGVTAENLALLYGITREVSAVLCCARHIMCASAVFTTYYTVSFIVQQQLTHTFP